MSKPSYSAFVFPTLALGLTLYMLIQQLAGGYRTSTVTYTLVVATPILMCGLVVLVREIRALRSRVSTSGVEDAKVVSPRLLSAAPPGRVAGFLGITVATLLSLEFLGYFVGFSIFAVLTMLLLGVRSYVKITLTTIFLIVIVHLLFVEWLQLGLPKGLTGPLL